MSEVILLLDDDPAALAFLNTVLTEAGFTIQSLTPFMATIYPLVWLSRRIARPSEAKRDLADAVRRERFRVKTARRRRSAA